MFVAGSGPLRTHEPAEAPSLKRANLRRKWSTIPKAAPIFVADAHRGDGKRLVVRADEKLTAFIELEAAVRPLKPRSSQLSKNREP